MGLFRRLWPSRRRPTGDQYQLLQEEVARLTQEVAGLSQAEREACRLREATGDQLQALAQGLHDLLKQEDERRGRDLVLQEGLERLAKEIEKLGREQLKANMLREGEAARTAGLIEQLTRSLELTRQEVDAFKGLAEELKREVRFRIITHLLSLMDALEAGTTLGEEMAKPAPRKKRWGLFFWRQQEKTEAEARAALVGPLQQWLEGVKLARGRLSRLLAAEGVLPIESLGRPFDPHLHRAVGKTFHPEVRENIVVEEELKGYCLDGRVIRYAEVIVNKAPKGDPAALPETEEEDSRS